MMRRPGERNLRPARDRDRGAALLMVLVLVIVGALIVIPIMTYTVSVLKANQVEVSRARNVEAAKGAIRTALRKPGDVFGNKSQAMAACPTDASTLLPAGGNVVNGVAVTIQCTPVSELSANEVFGFGVPIGAAQLEIAPDPANDGQFSGVVATSGQAPPYPTGHSPSWAWWPHYTWQNPDPDAADDTKSIWSPDLPSFTDIQRASTTTDTQTSITGNQSWFSMPVAFNCRVFLPGRYSEGLTITNTSATTVNYYFASGVYYFEKPVTIQGNVRVVVGQGLADFGVGNDCADDIQVGANLSVPAGLVYAIDGQTGGATWVFGNQGQLVVGEDGGGRAPTVQFNQRYAPAERGGWVNIMSVNGDSSWSASDTTYCDSDDDCFEDPSGNLTATNVNWVPRSRVLVEVTCDPGDEGPCIEPVALGSAGSPAYAPSDDDLTDEAAPPKSPTTVTAQARLASGSTRPIYATVTGVEGASTNGAIITEYQIGIALGSSSAPVSATTVACDTAGVTPTLIPVSEGSNGPDPWGVQRPENASSPDLYACFIPNAVTVAGTLSGSGNSSRYWVMARARNEAGWSGWTNAAALSSSSWSASSPATAAPAAPTGVTAVPYDADSSLPDAALVSWTAPASNNGAPITSYDVRVYRRYQPPTPTTTTSTTTTTTTNPATTSTSSTTSTTSTTTTTSTSTTTLPPTTTTTLPPTTTTTVPTQVCGNIGPPLSCSPPTCTGGQVAVAGYFDPTGPVALGWNWSCQNPCSGGEMLVFWTGVRQCADIPTGTSGSSGGVCNSDRYPENYFFNFFWRCTLIPGSDSPSITIDYPDSEVNAPTVICPSGTSRRWGYGTAYCKPNGSGFASPAVDAGSVASDVQAMAEVLASQSFVEALAPPAPVTVLIADQLCGTTSHMGVPGSGASDELQEWTPPATKCVLKNLPPLPATDGAGNQNIGYIIQVTAHNLINDSTATPLASPVMSITGTPGTLDPTYVRAWFPYWDPSSSTRPSKPVIDISATTSGGAAVTVDIPGYVAVPMGHIRINDSIGDPIKMTGGVLAGVLDTHFPTGSSLPFGYVPSLVMQRTVRLTATAGNVTSTAIVKINSDTSYGVTRWVTQ